MPPSASLSAIWQYDVPTSGSTHLPPDAGYAKALTNQGYGFEAAVADLIDNSIDAGADAVVVHFLRDADRIVSLLVIDNGRGMDDAALDGAMTVGRRRDYGDEALGMYGTGLKAASLSQAHSLTVISRTKRSPAAGRKLTAESIEDGFRCDKVESGFAQQQIDVYDGIIQWQGTIVRWDRVRAFETVAPGQSEQYLTKAISRLETHLGLYFNRFLSRGLMLDIAVWDVTTDEETDHISVEPLDPFGYKVPGKAGYPKKFSALVEGVGQMELEAHIWPAKSGLAGFRQIGPVQDRQGFYFYRNDRLVQAGGWSNLRSPEGHLVLARVAVDLPDKANEVFSLTVKKDGVEVTPAFTIGVEKAADSSGATFRAYLADAEATYREGMSRSVIERPKVIEPGKGLDPKVKRAVREELPLKEGEDPVRIEWVSLPEDQFFKLDRDGHAILLNKGFREDFNDGRRGGSNDAPMVKTLLYLLLQDSFGLGRWERKRADRIEYWNSILLAAAHAQRERRLRSGS
ncbi:ATP-binding protein [Streptomyces sp. TRM 70361]|uniref:ATP-binding protein n=1 Tax=Streptomyces sp. TRM 70361 TaxID=3116553 RepID=UPI002E7B3D89|nr:ATP-binding protein [Streptomyces sp. TRM 70361]MEE1941651.1 ATP-binding protein [Streptomyces sp. TRM 70361]